MNIILLREEYNLIQEDIALFLNVTRSAYTKIENKDYFGVKCEIFLKLAFLYNVRLEYLLGLSVRRGFFKIDNKQDFIKKHNINVYLLEKLRLEKHKYDYDYSEGSKK